MTVRVFQFPQYAAARSAQLSSAQYTSSPIVRHHVGGRPWGWLFLLSLMGGLWCALSGYAYSTRALQPEAGTWLMLGGVGLLAVSAVCLCLWLWCFLHRDPPWGRLIVSGLVLNYFLGRPLVATYTWAAPVDSLLAWGLLVGLVLRWRQLRRRRRPATDQVAPFGAGTAAQQDEAARWAAGATGKNIVADALARLGNDHVVIHNLPLTGRGDVDHVVVGPAGAVVIETKYLAGQIICDGGGIWTQFKRGEVCQIADPAAQVQRAGDGVADLLERRGLRDVPVYAVLVMAHPRAELDVGESSVLVVRPIELVPHLHQLAVRQPRLNAARVTTTANTLVGTSAQRHG